MKENYDYKIQLDKSEHFGNLTEHRYELNLKLAQNSQKEKEEE
jgi:hypothetical protein